MKFSICSLGCKVNNYEANWYRQQLSEKYEEVEFGQPCDICIINSCTVTNTAGSKTRQMMHKAKRISPDCCLVVVGCYIQMEFEKSEIFEDCDILIGTNRKSQLPALIEQFFETRERQNAVEKFNSCEYETMLIDDYDQTRAYLKIQDGCNQFCAYCTIPYARGRERCLDSDTAVLQARKLVEAGHLELVLTGIHTGRYHDGNMDLTGLIKRLLNEVDELKRIRISSIEMTEVTDELIQLMSEDERIARHLHIPLQVGCDRLLKMNNRPYTTQQYLEKIESIRKAVPMVSLSSDVMCGLPSESEEEFTVTRSFIEKANLSFLHVFPYSPKAHTPAAAEKNQIPEPIKKVRVSDLTKLSEQLYNDYINQFVDSESEVIFEQNHDGYWQGHNSEYILIKVKSEENLARQIRKVHIDSVNEDYLVAHLI